MKRAYKTTYRTTYKTAHLGSKMIHFEPEILAYIDGLTTPISNDFKIILNNYVKRIKAATNSSTLADVFDLLYILKGETEESSLRNLAKNSHHGEKVGVINFTQYQGLKGEGAGAIKTNYVPSSDAVAFGLTSATIFADVYTNEQDSNQVDVYVQGTTSNQRISMQTNSGFGYMSCRINQENLFEEIIEPPSSIAKNWVSRNGNAVLMYRNDVLIRSGSGPVTGIPDRELYIGARNTGTLDLYSKRGYGIFALGKYLTAEQIAAINAASAQFQGDIENIQSISLIAADSGDYILSDNNKNIEV